MDEIKKRQEISNKPQAVSISNDEIDVLARAAEAFFSGLSYIYQQQPMDNKSLMKALSEGKISVLAVAELSLAYNTPAHMQTEDLVARFFHAVFSK